MSVPALNWPNFPNDVNINDQTAVCAFYQTVLDFIYLDETQPHCYLGTYLSDLDIVKRIYRNSRRIMLFGIGQIYKMFNKNGMTATYSTNFRYLTVVHGEHTERFSTLELMSDKMTMIAAATSRCA